MERMRREISMADRAAMRAQIEEFLPLDQQEAVDKAAVLRCMDIFPDVFSRENVVCHFTASAWIVNPERTKALFILHKLAGQWRWPGGHADGETDLLKVALTEAREETGLEKLKILDEGIFSLEVFAIPGHVHKGETVNAHLHVDAGFIFEASEDEAIKVKPDENTDIRWMDFGAVEKAVEAGRMSDFYPRLIRKTKERF